MSAATEGTVGVSITAGHLIPTSLPINPVVGKGFSMGRAADFTIHITPDIAAQWIEELSTIITNEKSTNA